MNKSVKLEPTALEMIIARTLARLEESGTFTPEEVRLLRDAAVAGSFSKAKEIQAILERGSERAAKQRYTPWTYRT